MGFKLPGIKKAGSQIQNLDLNFQTPTRSLGNNVFKRTLRSRKAITTDQARKDKNDPTLNPYGATFQPSDTGLDFPYARSRFRLIDAGDPLKESEAIDFQLQNRGYNVLEQEPDFAPSNKVVVGYRPVQFMNYSTGQLEQRQEPIIEERGGQYLGKIPYTPEQIQENRLNLGIKFSGADGYRPLERQARQSAKISKTVSDAYDAVIRGDISPDDYMQVINDQAIIAFGDKEKDPLARGNQNYDGADLDAFNLTRDQLINYYQLAKDAIAAEDLIQQINTAKRKMAIDERDGELLPRTSLEDYIESLKPTALDERSGNFLVDGSGLMMRASEQDIAKRYKKIKK